MDGLILQCLTCSVPPQVVFTRYVTEARCTLSMVDEKLLIMGCGFRPRGHPDVRMDGERVIGLGDYLQLSKKKTRVEISQLASTPKYPNGSFNISIVYFESEVINPFNTHQTMFVQLFHSTMSAVQHLQYNICGTISAVQFLQYHICSTIISQSTPYWVTQY